MLHIKRSLAFNARKVKQSFKEDTEQAARSGFIYYFSVVKLHAVKMTLLKKRQNNTIKGIKDAFTAFLQSGPYSEGTVKFICSRDPRTNQETYYKQSDTIYGGVSASKQWAYATAPWFKKMGFTHGQNKRSRFYQRGKDLLILLYVEVCLAFGYTTDVKWIFKELEKKFKSHVPMTGRVDTDSPLLSPQGKTDFLTAVGMLGWLTQTVRFVVAYAYSLNAQHSASYTESAVNAVRTTVAYLQQSKQYFISARIYNDDLDVTAMLNHTRQGTEQWSFKVCSNHAGNAEIPNQRRSHTGRMIKINNAPFMWQFNVTSVTFALERTGEAHTDMSSGTVETYAAGIATLDIMATYTTEEMGMNFSFPFTLKIGNDVAKISLSRHRLQNQTQTHRLPPSQQWFQTLHCDLITPVHVDINKTDNDIFTKILDRTPSGMVRAAPWWSIIATKRSRLMKSAQHLE